MPLLLRAARRSDLPAIYRLLADAFPEVSRELFIMQTEQDPTFRFRHARVAVVDGHIVAYVRIFARRMLVRGVPLRAGGIGSVATSLGARSSGYATLLLEDAIREMEREGMALSFLFTGIPAFYERLGYRIVPEPYFEASRAEIVATARPMAHDVRPASDGDVPAMLSIYQRATAGSTGAIVRTRGTWRDATHWLDEGDGFVATSERGRIVAYIRSRCRDFGHQTLEADCLPGTEDAIGELLGALAMQTCDCGDTIIALVPDASALARTLRNLPSSTETLQFRWPMMLRPIADRVDDSIFEEPIYFWNGDRI